MLRIGIAAAALCLGLTGCQPSQEAPAVDDLWVQLPIVSGRPGAAYVTLRGGTAPATLKRVSSPQADSIEMHESRMDGGVMRMTPVEQVEIPAGGEVKFEPGGKHLMLFGLDPSLKPGDTMRIVFETDPHGEIVAEAEVRSPGGGHERH